MTTESMTPADLKAVTGGNDGWGGGDGAWWLIVLFLFAFTGWGNNRGGFGGGNGGGVTDGYVLASDFSQLSSQLSDGFNMIERRTDNITNGICDLGYAALQQSNQLGSQIASCCCDIREGISGVNYNMAMNANAIQSQLAQCCCDNREAIAGIRYDAAMNTNALQKSISDGFCQTNFNMQTATRDITDNANANTKAILDFLVQDKIQTLQSENEALRLQASQSMQNNVIISALKPQPVPAYSVPNPYANYGCGCN